MFIKKITKPDRKGKKTYTYYRLVHSYKLGNKHRQQTIINLGKLEELPTDKHKVLADRIEGILTGSMDLFFNIPSEVETLAQAFVKKIIEKGIFPLKKKARVIAQDTGTDYQEVDINSIEQLESRTIGGEWLVKQTFDKLGMDD
ncbi:MAG: hypothetical protein K8S16_11080, partial [Bacteroidales bacterium]|nr:hypothetical protein [Bacteroidales bacterium]